MGGPQPIASGPAPGSPSPSGLITASNVQSSFDTVDQCFAWLESNGMNWFDLKQESTGSPNNTAVGYTFECSIPDKQNPQFSKNYKTTAAAPTKIAALRAVINEITNQGASGH